MLRRLKKHDSENSLSYARIKNKASKISIDIVWGMRYCEWEKNAEIKEISYSENECGVWGLWLGDTTDEAKQHKFINRAEQRTRKLKENLWSCQEVS